MPRKGRYGILLFTRRDLVKLIVPLMIEQLLAVTIGMADTMMVASVGETAVVTSGSYQRFFTDMRGHTYHHIFNPDTGYPVSTNLLSVTIVCPDGTMADALSTAMFVLGESRALNYWRTYGGFEMILVNKNNEVICTSGLMEQITLSNTNYTLSFSE